MSEKIIVQGWYNKGNVGDDLFAEAFKHLFPNRNFKFTDEMSVEDLKSANTVFIGGGSFLNESFPLSKDAYSLLKTKNIFYIGVGAETNINEFHKPLLQSAKLIAIRTPQFLNKIKSINPNTIVIPDLVYSLPFVPSKKKIDKSVIILPNISVVPTCNDPHWKHVAWDYFKNEFAQFIDGLISRNYTVRFYPMCSSAQLDDMWAISELVSRLQFRNKKLILNKTEESTMDIISQYDICITQRYHGIILSELSKTHCLTIHHHDKLKNSNGPNLSYYETSKDKLHVQFNRALDHKNYNILPIDSNIFSELTQRVEDALCGR